MNKISPWMKLIQETYLKNNILGKMEKPIGSKANINRVHKQELKILFQKKTGATGSAKNVPP